MVPTAVSSAGWRSDSQTWENTAFRSPAAVAFAAYPVRFAFSAQQSKPWEQIPIPQLHAFHPQQPKRIELKNGIVIFLQEDHELPFIYGSVLDSRRIAR